MDGLRHINNAKYLTFLETARLEYLSTLGIDINRWDSETSVILAGMKVDYHRQSSYPNTYEIGCRITRLGNKSFDITSIVFNKDTQESICQSVITIVCFDFSSNKTVLVYNEIKNDYGK